MRQKRMVAALVAALLAAAAGDAGAESASARGRAVFEARCAGCHGSAGRAEVSGGRALKVRPLVDDPVLAARSPAELVAVIRANRKHASLRALAGLDDAGLADAAAYVRVLAAAH